MQTQQVRDPVCGMMVDPQTTKHTSEHMNQTYYFCSANCKTAFDTEPMKYMPQGQDRHSQHQH